MTGIEWTDKVWNPTTGCDRVSPGCDNCYALTMAKRLKGMGQAKYQRDGDPRTSGPGFGLTAHADALAIPFRWRKPKRIFVNSMSDLFHDDVPDEFIAKVFAVMALTPRHTFQILTKRHGRMRSLLNSDAFWTLVGEKEAVLTFEGGSQWSWDGQPLPNVWLGVSVEDQQRAELRIPALLATPAAVRWLSCEPLLGPIVLSKVELPQWGHAGHHAGMGTTECPRSRHHHHDERCKHPIDWVVVGGESGPKSRPMDADWARSLRNQCVSVGVPFFFKQWGAWGPSPEAVTGRLLDGRTWDEYPVGAGHTRKPFRRPGRRSPMSDERRHFLFIWPCGCPFSVMTRDHGVTETNAWIEALETDERVDAAREAGVRMVHISHQEWADEWEAKFVADCGHPKPNLPPVAKDRSDALGETDHEGIATIASGLVLREGSELWAHVSAVLERLRPDVTPFDRRELVHEILQPLRRVFDDAFN